MAYYRLKGNDLILQIHVQPNAKQNQIIGVKGDALKIKIASPPLDDKANQCLIKFLAKTFNVPSSDVKLVRGEKARKKVVLIHSPKEILILEHYLEEHIEYAESGNSEQ